MLEKTTDPVQLEVQTLRRRVALLEREYAEQRQELARRKLAEERQRQSEARLRLVTDSLPFLIAYVDAGLRYRFNNKAYETWYGDSPESYQGKHVKDVLGEAAFEVLRGPVEKVLSGQQATFQGIVPYRVGGPRYVETVLVPDLSENKEVKGYIVLVNDVSKRKQAEESVNQSEERFRQLAESIQEVFWMVSLPGGMLYVSPVYEKIWGRSRAPLYENPRAWLDHVIPEDRGDVVAFLDARRYEDPGYHEFRIVRPDGSIRWIRNRIFPIRDEAGKICRLTGAAEDITDRKQAESALRESEIRLRLMVERMPAILWTTDREIRITSGEGAGLPWLGLKPNQVVGMTLAEYLHTDDPLLPAIAAHRRALAGESSSYEMAWQSRTYHAHVEPFLDAAQRITGCIGVALDITERKQAEEDLKTAHADLERRVQERTADLSAANACLEQEIVERQRAEQVLQAYSDQVRDLYNHAPCGYHSLDADGTFVRINDTELAWLGYERDEILGKKFADVITPEGKRDFQENFPLFKERGWVRDLEFPMIRKDGTILPVLLSSTAVKDAHGCYVTSRSTLIDLTERKAAEERLRRKEAEMAHVLRLSTMGEMAKGLAHELNQPLTSTSLYINVCERRLRQGTVATAELLQILGQAAGQAELAGKIIHQLRSFVQRREPHRVPANINQLIRNVLVLTKPDMHAQGARLILQLAEPLSNVAVDRVQIEQVILNLVRNGIESMVDVTGSERELIIQTIQTATAIEVTVRDTGCGLAAEVLPRLFDPWFTTKPLGMGMGLAISRSIVEAHMGTLKALPDRNRGAVFQLTLPLDSGG